MLFSLSKSFTSTAVGLAVAEGKLKRGRPGPEVLSRRAPAEPSANLKAMRVRDLLTMSTGHQDEDVRDFTYNADESVVKDFLARPVAHKPGTLFLYNTPATYMLSAIVQKVTGQTALDYLRPRLFEPLGIVDPTWDASKQGVSLGGFGFNVRTEDIARFGQFYLQTGEWQGKQLSRPRGSTRPPPAICPTAARRRATGSRATATSSGGAATAFTAATAPTASFASSAPTRCGHRDHERHARHAIRDEPRVGSARARPSGRQRCQPTRLLMLRSPRSSRSLTLRPQTSSAAIQQRPGTLAGRRYAFRENPLALEALSLDTTERVQTTFTSVPTGAPPTRRYSNRLSGEWVEGHARPSTEGLRLSLPAAAGCRRTPRRRRSCAIECR